MLIDLLFLELIGEEKLKEQKEKSLPRFSYRYFSLSLHTNKKVATKQQCIKNYIMELNNLYVADVACEHAYRVLLQNLLNALLPKGYIIVKEPARIACGAPDYIILLW